MPRAKRFNPKQVFVIISTTREDIASDVNGIIENEGWDIPKFKPDDTRLTKAFCEAFCEASNDAMSEVDEIVDKEYEWQREVLAGKFGLDLDPEG